MGPKRNNILYVKPNEPAFLRKMKQQAGYKEGPTVDTKREVYDSGDEDEFPEDNNEEQPTVVVLKSGDLTAEEAKQEEERIREREDKELIESGKIIFKSAKKRNTEPEDKPIEESKKPKKERSPGRIVKTKCLLSFDDEVDEED